MPEEVSGPAGAAAAGAAETSATEAELGGVGGRHVAGGAECDGEAGVRGAGDGGLPGVRPNVCRAGQAGRAREGLYGGQGAEAAAGRGNA